MSQSLRVLCMIPVYNEEDNLTSTIEAIREHNYGVSKFLFIDSCSTDNSKNILDNQEFEVIRLNRNKGIGLTIFTAIKYCIENNYDVITLIHGGNKMDTKDFPAVLDPIFYEDFDCVWGSRFLEDTSINMPKFRKNVNPILSDLVSKFFNKQVTDATNGFRAYKIETILKILPKYDRKWLYGYSFEGFLFGKMLQDNELKCKEVAVTIKYNDKKKNTKIRPIIDYPSIVLPYFLAKYIN